MESQGHMIQYIDGCSHSHHQTLVAIEAKQKSLASLLHILIKLLLLNFCKLMILYKRHNNTDVLHDWRYQLRFILHGTPRQWSDKRRDWIRNEKDKMLYMLESEVPKSLGKIKVFSRYYFADMPPSMQMHFEIIESLDAS